MNLLNLILTAGATSPETKPWHIALGLFLVAIIGVILFHGLVWIYKKIFGKK